VTDLAEATEDEVLKLWQGLGYYSRARNLHAAARQIVAMGHFPDTLKTISQLKGVGDYTASAIAAFAFDRPAVAIDGNAYRVFARLLGIATPINTTEGRHEFRLAGERLFGLTTEDISRQTTEGKTHTARPQVSGVSWREANSALMDLGATVCTPQSPQCDGCPLADDCVACHEGLTDRLPVKRKTVKTKTRHMAFVWMRCRGEVALRRRGEGDIWQGLWEPPLYEDVPVPALDGRLTLLQQGIRHTLTHRIIVADFYLLETDKRPPLPADDYVWVAEENIGHYAVPRLIEKLQALIRA
jgi:A/G-specific adenine glycosylase